MLQPGDNAIAVRTENGWVLKPCCTVDDAASGLTVRAGNEWVLTPANPVEAAESALVITDASGEKVLLPINCPEESTPDTGGDTGSDTGGGDTGTPADQLCGYCDADEILYDTYEVTVSGMPSSFFCPLTTCNGTWTVTWVSDCVWHCDIDAEHRIALRHLAGGTWVVSASNYTPGGCEREMICQNCAACDPTGSYVGTIEGSATVV